MNVTERRDRADRGKSTCPHLDLWEGDIINLFRFFSYLTLKWHYKAVIGKGTLGVCEQLHALDRFVHILTYHAANVYGWCVGLLHAYNE